MRWFQSRLTIPVCIALLRLSLLGVSQTVAPISDPWLVVPGKSVGPITAQTTPAQIKLLFPGAQIREDMVSSGGDSAPEPATVINGDHQKIALTVFWDKPGTGPHPAPAAHPSSINLCYGNGHAPKNCQWHLANNIGFGTSLQDLEKQNGRPFQLAGFEWDYSGLITNWNGGKLQRLWNTCGQIVLQLRPAFASSGPGPQQAKLYEQVIGDGKFLSSHPAMQQLNPAIYAITVKLPASGNCPAK